MLWKHMVYFPVIKDWVSDVNWVVLWLRAVKPVGEKAFAWRPSAPQPTV